MLAKRIIKEILKYIALCFLIMLLLFPLYFLMVNGLKTNASALENKLELFPQSPQWENFITIINKRFWEAFGWTLLFATTLIALRVVVYSLAIGALLSMNKQYQKYFLYFFLVISLVPEFSIYLSLIRILHTIRIDTTVFGAVANGIFSFFTFTYIFNIAKSIKDRKEKLMVNDNLKWHQKIIYVYLPKLKLAYFLLVIFTFISVWNDYLWPNILLRNSDKSNITIWYLSLGNVQGSVLLNIQAAGATLSVIVPLVLYSIVAKKINRFN